MFVKKRNGSLELFNLESIRKQTIDACKNLNFVSYEELELDCKIMFTDGMETKDIQLALIKTAENKISIEKSDWSYVAARLRLYDLYHNLKHIYGVKNERKDIYASIPLTKYFQANKSILSGFMDVYTNDDIEELNNYIKADRDLLFNNPAIRLLVEKYLIKNGTNVVELPQHMFMSVAMYVAQNEIEKVKYAKLFYDKLSTLKFIAATPINANGRLKNGMTASCLITSVADSLESIMTSATRVAHGSKNGAGWGIDFSRLRGVSSTIANVKNVAGGIIPFLKVFSDLNVAVNQKGVRNGSSTVTIECWHLEVMNFLDLRKDEGEERLRARDLFLCLSVPDLFIKRFKNKSNWTLFDPYDVRDLTELFGEEFEKRYEYYEKDFLNNPDKYNPNTRQIPASELMVKWINQWFTTGKVFCFFKDTVNRAHPYNNIIRSSNLCQEILQPTDENTVAVCNLGSINLARVDSDEDLKDTCKIATRFLDNVIDVSGYSSEEAKKTQLSRRSIGIGTISEAEVIAKNHIMYGSKEHAEYIEKTYSLISKTIEDTSRELAKEKGGCDYDPSIRNSYRMAIAPNTSSGILACGVPSCEPIYDKLYSESSKIGTNIFVAPGIDATNYQYYVSAYKLDQLDLLRMTAIRQKYIDMSISHSVYIDPNDPKWNGKVSIKYIRDIILTAHELGIKTLYYLRSQAPRNDNTLTTKYNDISCVGCEN